MSKFYAVSTGPAGADYLTLGAIKVLKKCASIFYPITGDNSHVAFDCVCEAIDITDKNCVGVKFSMTPDKVKTQAEYDSFEKLVLKELVSGDVAFVAIGDVSIYSTAARLAKSIEKKGSEIEFIAGVTSFCAGACEFNLDLAERDDEIRIIPGDAYYKSGKIETVLKDSGTKIFMKSPRHLEEIVQKIIDLDFYENSYLVQGAGYDSQKLFSGEKLKSLPSEVFDRAYMSVLIVLGK